MEPCPTMINKEVNKEEVDSLILGKWLLTMSADSLHSPHPLKEEAGVAVRGDRLVAIGQAGDLEKRYQAREIFRFPHHLIMPGLINAHTHAAMTLFRGLADDLPLMDWLQGYIFPAEKKLSNELVFDGTKLACLEMMLGGITTFVDMYLFEQAVARATEEAGLRAIVGEVLYDFPSPNYGPIEEGFNYTEELIRQWQNHPLIYPAVEPHSPYTCSPELLQKSKRIAEKYNVPFIIHLSETQQEVQIIKERYGKTPVEHLHSLGVLDHQVLADHCVWLTKRDMDLLQEKGARVVHMPESNMKLASGVAPIPELLKRQIPVGLGTDGCASNNNLDLFQEMDMAAKLHKVFSEDPTVMKAEQVVEMATIGGAKALGLDQEIGSLEEGKKADFIVLDLHKPHLVPMYNIFSHLVYTVHSGDVDSVWVNGRCLVHQRVPKHLDQMEILNSGVRFKEKILSFIQR